MGKVEYKDLQSKCGHQVLDIFYDGRCIGVVLRQVSSGWVSFHPNHLSLLKGCGFYSDSLAGMVSGLEDIIKGKLSR